MEKAEVVLHLQSIVGNNESLEQLTFADSWFIITLGKVYLTIRPALVFLRPFFKLKRAWSLGLAALMLVLDTKYLKNKDE